MVVKAGLWLLLGGFLGACALVYLQRRTGTLPSGAAPGTDELLRRWEAGGVPPDQRSANFVLEDARGCRDPLRPPAPRSGMDGMLARARTTLGIRARAQAGPFAGELCREPGAIYKSYDDLLDRRDDRFIRSLVNDILKAHEAGAKINIFASGRAAEAALKAAKKLEGLPGAPKVRIDTLVTVGMSEDQLRELDPVGRSGGYDYAEAAPPDLASLQPGRDAGSGAREGSGKKPPSAVPARGAEPAAGKAFFVTGLIACAGTPKCRGTLTEETPVLGYLGGSPPRNTGFAPPLTRRTRRAASFSWPASARSPTGVTGSRGTSRATIRPTASSSRGATASSASTTRPGPPCPRLDASGIPSLRSYARGLSYLSWD